VEEIRETGRNAQGVRLIRLDEGDRLVAMATVARDDDQENGAGQTPSQTAESPQPSEPGPQEPPAPPADDSADGGTGAAGINGNPVDPV